MPWERHVDTRLAQAHRIMRRLDRETRSLFLGQEYGDARL